MYVLVSGLPGSGKTTIAGPLAVELGLPLLARDDIKEALWDALGPGDVKFSRSMGAASNEVFKRVARSLGSAVLDNFFHYDDRPNVEALGGPFLEVHCAPPPAIAKARYEKRSRHPCHFDLQHGVPQFDRWIEHDNRALGLGEVLEVDTTQPVDVVDVAAWVRARVTRPG
jgi:predicted kinase